MKSRLYISCGVVLALALAYGAASWYTGKQAQLRIEQTLEQANQQLSAAWPGGQRPPALQLRDYQRGWFTSAIEYAFTFQDDEGREQVLRLHDDLQHGPFPWRALSAGEMSPLLASSQVRLLPTEALRVWFESRQGASPLQIDTRVSFDGTAHSFWRFDPAQFTQDGVRIDFSGGRLELEFDQRLKATQANGAFDFLNWEDAATGERSEFRAMTFEGHNAFASEEDMQIHHQARIGQIIITQDQQPALTVEGTQVKLDSSRIGGLLDGALAYEFDSVRLGDADLGRFDARMRIEHIDVLALKALLSAWERLNPGQADDEDLSIEDQELLKEKIRVLLASSPYMAIDPLKWKNGQGESQAVFAVHFMPAGDDAAPGEDLGTMLERSLRQVQLSLSVSKPMLVQVFGQLDTSADADRMQALASMLFDHYTASMQRAGLIEVEDGVASLNISYQSGEVVLGGTKMPVAAFIALIQGAMG